MPRGSLTLLCSTLVCSFFLNLGAGIVGVLPQVPGDLGLALKTNPQIYERNPFSRTSAQYLDKPVRICRLTGRCCVGPIQMGFTLKVLGLRLQPQKIWQGNGLQDEVAAG